MAGTFTSPNLGPFTLTRPKILIIVSLIFTWFFAHLLPRYQPAIRSVVQSRLDEARKKMPSIQVDWHRDEDQDPRLNYDVSKVALLIEPRYLPHLVPLMLHMVTVVPPDWRFVFIGSEKSTKAVGRSFAIQHQQVIGKLDIMVLPEPWDIGSKEMVYRLMTDMRFYDEFLPGVEWILKYESDSMLCANSETSLNDWLQWSWAGAARKSDDRFAGNGGLSLRKVSAIRKVLTFQARYNDTNPEDEWFGTRLWVLTGEKVATVADGVFAVEDYYVENPMGFHIRDGGADLRDEVWKNQVQRKAIFDYCPELSMIMDMKLDRERCPGDDGEGNIDTGEADRIKKEEEAKKKEEEARKKQEEEAKKKQEEENKEKKEQAGDKTEKQRDAETESEDGAGSQSKEEVTSESETDQGDEPTEAITEAAEPINPDTIIPSPTPTGGES